MNDQNPLPAPGWYADPASPETSLRYWDGADWTEHVHPVAGEPAAPADEPAAEPVVERTDADASAPADAETPEAVAPSPDVAVPSAEGVAPTRFDAADSIDEADPADEPDPIGTADSIDAAGPSDETPVEQPDPAPGAPVDEPAAQETAPAESPAAETEPAEPATEPVATVDENAPAAPKQPAEEPLTSAAPAEPEAATERAAPAAAPAEQVLHGAAPAEQPRVDPYQQPNPYQQPDPYQQSAPAQQPNPYAAAPGGYQQAPANPQPPTAPWAQQGAGNPYQQPQAQPGPYGAQPGPHAQPQAPQSRKGLWIGLGIGGGVFLLLVVGIIVAAIAFSNLLRAQAPQFPEFPEPPSSDEGFGQPAPEIEGDVAAMGDTVLLVDPSGMGEDWELTVTDFSAEAAEAAYAAPGYKAFAVLVEATNVGTDAADPYMALNPYLIASDGLEYVDTSMIEPGLWDVDTIEPGETTMFTLTFEVPEDLEDTGTVLLYDAYFDSYAAIEVG